MTPSWKFLAATSLAALTVLSGDLAATGALARGTRDVSTPTVTATALLSASGTPTGTVVSASGTPTAAASASGTAAAVTGTPAARTSGTPTAVKAATGSATKTSTPTKKGPTATSTVPPRQKSGLPAAVVLESGNRMVGVGLDQKKALLMANSLVPRLFVVAPRYVPKGFALQLIHIDPAQDQQTPPAASLQYVPKTLASAKGAYPSFYVSVQTGLSSVIFPGVKPKVVTINAGKKGVGVVKGTVVDLKPKKGDEIVHVLWTRLSISYDVSSNISKSKLSVAELLKVATSLT